MADSSQPLMVRQSPNAFSKSDSAWESLRKFGLACQPFALLSILALCIVALVYPFWDDGKSLLSQASNARPFITKDTASALSLRSDNKQFLVKQDLSKDALNDMVSGLPGISMDSTSDIVHYSGYVDALEGRQIHYWFFEAENDADNAPLFFWTNGGPGCSGLTGLLTEHGPFWAIDDGELMVNEYSWHKEVNIAYFEQPYGVGFSTVDEGMDAVSGDDQAVADFDAAIRSFITKFPQFQDRDIYLSSESFGGHYMPLTALEVMKNNDAGMTPKVNLGGFMVGNPYTNGYENTIGAVEAFYGHGLMRNDIYETWSQYCFGDETAMDNTHCRYIYMIAYYEADNVDHYAVDFNYCEDDVAWDKNQKHLLFKDRFVTQNIDRLLNKFKTEAEWDSYTDKEIRPLFKNRKGQRPGAKRGAIKLLSRKDVLSMKAKIEGQSYAAAQDRRRLNIEWAYDDTPYYPCAGDLMTSYLNQDTVQDALHVKNADWEMCNDQVFQGWPESDWDNKMQPYYAELAAKYPQLKILVFSGDDDSVCGVHGTQYWLDNMDEYGWSVDSNDEWTPWQYHNQLAGYSTTYLTSNGDVALYFHTIRTAGHMVPQTQPARGLGILKKYLHELK